MCGCGGNPRFPPSPRTCLNFLILASLTDRKRFGALSRSLFCFWVHQMSLLCPLTTYGDPTTGWFSLQWLEGACYPRKVEEVTLMDYIALETLCWQKREAATLEHEPLSRVCSDEIIFLINLDNSQLKYGSVCNNGTFFPFLSSFYTSQVGELVAS